MHIFTRHRITTIIEQANAIVAAARSLAPEAASAAACLCTAAAWIADNGSSKGFDHASAASALFIATSSIGTGDRRSGDERIHAANCAARCAAGACCFATLALHDTVGAALDQAEAEFEQAVNFLHLAQAPAAAAA